VVDKRRSPLRLLSLLALIGLSLSVAVITVVRPDGSSLVDKLKACQTNDCVVELLLTGLAADGPEQTLAAYASTSPNSGGSIDCHDATHRLGEKAWQSAGFKAWVGSGNVCNFGYYHGLMVGASENADVDEFAALAQRWCVDEALPVKDLPGAECLHGFGHAVFHLSDSITEAVDRCDAFASLGPTYQRRCNEGVIKDSLIGKPAVTIEDFERCATWPLEDQGTCVYVTSAYAVVRAADLGAVRQVCELVTSVDLVRECQDGLGRGVSMRAVGQRFQNPSQWALEVCGTDQECAFGFGKSVYFIRNDQDWSIKQCGVFDAHQRDRCRAGVLFVVSSRLD
jgi:hypothetical protein